MFPEYGQTGQGQDWKEQIMENKAKVGAIGGGGFVLLLILITIMINILTGGVPISAKIAATQAHVAELAEFADETQNDLVSGALKRQNANVAIILAGAANNLGRAVAKYGGAEPAEELASANAARLAHFQAVLKKAFVANTYDATYQSRMTASIRRITGRLTNYKQKTPPAIDKMLTETVKQLTKARKRLQKVEL